MRPFFPFLPYIALFFIRDLTCLCSFLEHRTLEQEQDTPGYVLLNCALFEEKRRSLQEAVGQWPVTHRSWQYEGRHQNILNVHERGPVKIRGNEKSIKRKQEECIKPKKIEKKSKNVDGPRQG